MRRTVLVISFSDLARDPRVDRQIRWLQDDSRIIAAGFGPPAVEGVEFVDLGRLPVTSAPAPARSRIERLRFAVGRVANIPRRLRRLARRWLDVARHLARHTAQYEREYWSGEPVPSALRALDGVAADLVVANDLDVLPLAQRVARGAPVLFDAHEYSPREFDQSRWFRFYVRPYRDYLCRTYVARSAAMTTVCEGIAAEYARQAGVAPVVVTNAPEYQPLAPRIVVAEPERIQLVHHGLAARVRGIEKMIEMMAMLDERFELSFMFAQAEPDYLSYLERLARPYRVRFLPAVPMRELPWFTNQFDVGVFLLEPVNFNYLHALPNKFFEFIQARLAVAIGPSPEMARIVRKHDLGVVAPDFTAASLAREVGRLDRPAVERYKRNADAVARELSAERNAGIVRSIVERLTPAAARLDTSLVAGA